MWSISRHCNVYHNTAEFTFLTRKCHMAGLVGAPGHSVEASARIYMQQILRAHQAPPPSEILNLKQLALPRNPSPTFMQPLYQFITVPALLSQMVGVPHGQRRATPACYLSRLASTCQPGRPWASPTLISALQTTQPPSITCHTAGLAPNTGQDREGK